MSIYIKSFWIPTYFTVFSFSFRLFIAASLIPLQIFTKFKKNCCFLDWSSSLVESQCRFSMLCVPGFCCRKKKELCTKLWGSFEVGIFIENNRVPENHPFCCHLMQILSNHVQLKYMNDQLNMWVKPVMGYK